MLLLVSSFPSPGSKSVLFESGGEVDNGNPTGVAIWINSGQISVSEDSDQIVLSFHSSLAIFSLSGPKKRRKISQTPLNSVKE